MFHTNRLRSYKKEFYKAIEAYKKLAELDSKNPEIYLIDLSTVNGISDAKMIMHAGDIVYIDPFINYANFIVTDIGGILGLVSSVIIVYSLFLGRNTRL